MQHDTRDDEGWQKEHVNCEESGESQCTKRLSTTDDPHEEVADDRNSPYHIDAYLRRPIGGLIPGQQIAGEGKPHHKQKQHDADHPHHFAWWFERTIEEYLKHVQTDRDHHT